MPFEGDGQLTVNDIHIWKSNLACQTNLSFAQSILSADEWARAQRFHFEHDRAKFIAAHCAQRIILGNYLHLSPRAVCFYYSDAGKPALDPAIHSERLQFNLSHSHELAVMGVALDRQMGIDVEHVRPIADVEQLVKRFFAPDEQASWRALPDDERLSSFFDGWTRKEAFLKAIGLGLNFPSDHFAVSLHPNEPAKIRWIKDDAIAPDHWFIQHFVPAPNYTAAVVAQAPACKLTLYDFESNFAFN